jgi:hypothetical protein
MQMSDLKTLNIAEIKKQYQIKISQWYATLENLNDKHGLGKLHSKQEFQ